MKSEINPNVFIVYLAVGDSSPQKVSQICGEMLANIQENIARDDERWMVLPSDRTYVEYLTLEPLTIEKAEAFIQSQKDVKDYAKGKIGLELK